MPSNTTHLVCWFVANKIDGNNVMPIPSGEKLNLFDRLLQETAKLSNTDAPMILMYDKKNLSSEQINKLYETSYLIPNLFIVDFDSFMDGIRADSLRGDIEETIRMNTAGESFPGSPPRGSVCDLTEMVQIYSLKYPGLAKQIVLEDKRYNEEKYSSKLDILKKSPHNQLIKRDLDIILKTDKMPEITSYNSVKCIIQGGVKEDLFLAIAEENTELYQKIFKKLEDFGEIGVKTKCNIFKLFDFSLNDYHYDNLDTKDEKIRTLSDRDCLSQGLPIGTTVQKTMSLDAIETNDIMHNLNDKIQPGQIQYRQIDEDQIKKTWQDAKILYGSESYKEIRITWEKMLKETNNTKEKFKSLKHKIRGSKDDSGISKIANLY